MSPRTRLVTMLVSAALLTVAAAGYAVNAARLAHQRDAGAPARDIDLRRPGQIIFRDTRSGRIAAVSADAPAGQRTLSALSCDRVYAAATTAVCLASRPAATPAFSTVLLDHRLNETRRLNPPGLPNRARLAPDGHLVAWTAFVTGHSYATTGFSTRTSILDLANDKYYADIETIRISRDGRQLGAPDLNLWGVTFTPDGKRFYASASTGGTTYLIEGDMAAWEARTVRENAECPSLSPDGTRLVFKKHTGATGARPWRLHVLDLATMREIPLPGTHEIDDQAVWFGNHTVMFARNRDGTGSDIWATAADGRGTPWLLIADASSPSAI